MLNPNWINQNLDDITVLTSDLHTAILTSIAKHVADSLRVQPEKGIMPSTKTQIESAGAAGLLREDIEKYVAEYLHVAVPEVRALFEDAAVESISADNEIYREAGVEPIGLSPAMQNIINTRADTFTATLRRLTGTIATNSEELFERTLNAAYSKVVAGTHSYTEALGEASDDMLREGITHFEYIRTKDGKVSTRKITTEAAILMNIRTSIAQTAGEITEQGMRERGASFIECSKHMGERNKDVPGRPWANHESWGGGCFFWKEIAVEPNMEIVE